MYMKNLFYDIAIKFVLEVLCKSEKLVLEHTFKN